jgi:hypothetical protein
MELDSYLPMSYRLLFACTGLKYGFAVILSISCLSSLGIIRTYSSRGSILASFALGKGTGLNEGNVVFAAGMGALAIIVLEKWKSM